jgi:hypothetical protein
MLEPFETDAGQKGQVLTVGNSFSFSFPEFAMKLEPIAPPLCDLEIGFHTFARKELFCAWPSSDISELILASRFLDRNSKVQLAIARKFRGI